MVETKDLIVVGLIGALIIVLILEMRYLRSRNQEKRERKLLPDKAHNAITTTKAILQLVARRGGDVTEARDLVRQADTAYRRGNHRVAVEVAQEAKTSLRAALREVEVDEAESGADTSEGEPSAEESPEAIAPEPESSAGPPAERTTKEILTEEYPPHYVQAKFALNTAREALRGRDPASKGRKLLDRAETAFEREDYETALSRALRAPKIEEDAPEPQAEAVTVVCVECDAPLREGDEFCRQCGARVEATPTCPGCGRESLPEDAYCRGCGVALA